MGFAQGDCHGLSVEFGALRAGVGVVFGKQGRGHLPACGFETVASTVAVSTGDTFHGQGRWRVALDETAA
jgi:hypothetical protein